jgi:oligopeptide transport system ATP-binding protein
MGVNMSELNSQSILQVQDLKKHFPIKRGLFQHTVATVKAIDGISFELRSGETLGLVGESGCGKTTIGKCILKLYQPDEGSILFNGNDIKKFGSTQTQAYRTQVQAIFQDPYSSLNPRMSVSAIVSEPLDVNAAMPRNERRDYVTEVLNKVGIKKTWMNRFPHEFSGGQRQRICIARALVLRPKVIVCDEPVSALDVSIQAQVINLLEEIKSELDLSLLFISHDLSVVEYVSDRIAVMYLGKIVEIVKDTDLYANPLHPYTNSLLAAVPIPDPKRRRIRKLLRGEISSPIDPPPGCKFQKRCPVAKDICFKENPPLNEVEKDHFVACYNFH